ncbi:MAG: hypothetical protein Q8L44_09395 [Sulfuritalea sp.]|nr:hypothetical protein [Sulfuritalea sp.]
MAHKLAEYVRMEAHDDLAHHEDRPDFSPGAEGSRLFLWAVGLLAVALITALAFGAYRQPELLLNLMGLRYCG